jgi:rod shape determining protein RodA
MTPLLRKFLGMNWVLFAVMIALIAFGVVAVYSASFFKTDEYWRKQASWAAAGVVIFLVVSLTNYRWIKWGGLPLYLAGIVFLILTYTKFGSNHGGAKCWLKLPGLPEFQPSQICLIAGIMVLSLFMSSFRRLHPMLRLLFCGAIAGGPMILILKQPDVGMTMVWGPVLLALLFAGGLPLRYLVCILLLVAAMLPLAYNLAMKPYQRARITAFIDPEIDPQGSAWAINQSLIAVGSGGWAGKGFKADNTQIQQGFLPGTTVHTDYIYSAIAEQWGFIGGVFLVSTFALLLLTCLTVALRSADDVGLMICVSITVLIFFQVFQNVGMTIGLMPITGLPLPLISYGGSFLIVVMFGLGLVNSVWIHRKTLTAA